MLSTAPFPKVGKINVRKVFEHECGCCLFNGTLIRDGDWIIGPHIDGEMFYSNITCIKGALYKAEHLENDVHFIDKDHNGESMSLDYEGVIINENQPQEEIEESKAIGSLIESYLRG